MANEAVNVETPRFSRDWTVGDTSGIEQFTLCVITADNTTRLAQASTSTSSALAFAGISMVEKKAASGTTNIGMTRGGVWDLVAKTVDIAAGVQVVISGANTIRAAVAGDLLTGAVVGHTLEKITGDAAGEVQLVGE